MKCIDCKNFHYYAPEMDCPYPVMLCAKGHWEGCECEEHLYDEIECEDGEEI